ncbi:MAG: carbohydrate kinase family protein, partial [Deltaproteobacteria bacterium]|nr:carbohydrate kinase family protein [Deltaproteobacteria bacterium]
RRIPYIFDPGQQVPVLGKEDLLQMISGSRLFISNDYELELVMRITGREKSQLLELNGALITTLGDRGSIVSSRDGDTEVPAVKASKVLDPTGAGDAFRAGLIKGLVMGKPLMEAARMGAVCASFGVECQGTQCHRFTEEEFWARYQANFG